MAMNVYANSRDVSHKSGGGKTIAAWPDVCITPPQTPGQGPIPLPYANAIDAMAASGDEKSKTIQKTMVKKAQEGGYKHVDSATKAGMVSQTSKGKTYFTSWNMDVKVEGTGVSRQLDPMLQNDA